MNPTPDPTAAQAEDDPRLLRATQAYLAELEAGRRPERRAFVARFPGLADALAPYLDALELVHGAAPRMQSSLGRRAPAEPPPAEPLGDFRIEREIGRGGMGVVYEAVQMSLGRRVALKVLPFAAALDAKQLQRFQNEAQAAAQLHHTNIVPVYAVGCERGVHYYAMQLIEGQNLADLIVAMRPSEPTTSPGAPVTGARPRSAGPAADLPPTGPPLDTSASPPAPATLMRAAAELSTQRATRSAGFYRTAARLAAQAAEALEHAHQVGVIHRDIKPANLLVDARGNLWVTDFGLAQFQNRAGLTRTGDLLGTLRYMSPEQAAGQGAALDQRTDIYSLGATLYELLTLEPLFAGTDHARLLRQIVSEEPRSLRAVDRAVPPELETIVLKAVSKSPADRYATAQEFADDLHRFLDNQPIRARRPNLVQRTRKWGQRHPSVIVASIVLLVLLSAGSLVGAVMINSERERADQQRDRADKRADEAEKRFLMARHSVDDMIDVSEEVLVDKPDMMGLRMRLLESAVDYYKQFIEQHPDDPSLVNTQARVKTILSDLKVLQATMRLPLLQNDAVLEDLHATVNQKAMLVAFFDRRNTAAKEQFDKPKKDGFNPEADLSPEQRRQVFLKQARANDAEIKTILSVEQLQRLGQVALQVQGTGAFRQPDVVAALRLTAPQKEQIGGFERDVFFHPPGDHHGEPGPGGPPGDRHGEPGRGGPRKDPQEIARRATEAMDKSLAVLTEDQRRRWREMTGEPFKGALDSFRFGGPPWFGGFGPGGFGRGGPGKAGFGSGKPGGRGGEQPPRSPAPPGTPEKPNGEPMPDESREQ